VRHPLDRKLRRDLRSHLGSLIAIAIVVACGQAAFIAERSMARMLTDAQRSYYAQVRFPEIFARVRRAPEAVTPSLRAIPGVARLETRVAGDVVLRVPGLREPATAHLVGLRPETAQALNRILLREGRRPEPGERDAVLVSEAFAEANDLALGDTLGAVLGERWQTLRIVGIGITAEFVYEIRAGDMLPDAKRYGVLWLDEETLADAFGYRGAWNEVALTLQSDADPRAVIAAIDAALEPYGTPGAYARARHPSHEFLSSEIRENKTFALVIPAIFLGVAAFLVHLVLGRVVTQQREQVGTLKAFGMPNAELVRHYALFALVPVGAGTVLGGVFGLWFANYLAGIYLAFFRFPSLSVTLYPREFVMAVAIAVVAALVGALSALRRLLAMPPAEAMRPEPPATYAHGRVERFLTGRFRRPIPRMIVRGLSHRPWRTVLGALGIGLAAAVVVVGTFGFDGIGRMREILFGFGTRADITVVFREAQGPAALSALATYPGVHRVEAVREVAVRVRHGHRDRLTSLQGIDPQAELRRLVDLQGESMTIPSGGVALGVALSTVLEAGVGDTVDLEFIDGRGRRLSRPVTALIDDLSGLVAYVPVEDFASVLGVGEAITSADLAVDADQRDALYDAISHLAGVQAVVVRSAMQRAFDVTLRESFYTVLMTLVLFASALSIGTIYNAGRVTLSERARDLTSLRVLGFTRGEVARILFGEIGALGLIGLPVGLLMGVGLAAAVVASFGTGELFRMPFVIGPRTLLLGVVIPILAGFGAALPLTRRLNRLDLVRVLKTRE
jgi:putative ABC transport system permease protein